MVLKVTDIQYTPARIAEADFVSRDGKLISIDSSTGLIRSTGISVEQLLVKNGETNAGHIKAQKVQFGNDGNVTEGFICRDSLSISGKTRPVLLIKGQGGTADTLTLDGPNVTAIRGDLVLPDRKAPSTNSNALLKIDSDGKIVVGPNESDVALSSKANTFAEDQTFSKRLILQNPRASTNTGRIAVFDSDNALKMQQNVTVGDILSAIDNTATLDSTIKTLQTKIEQYTTTPVFSNTITFSPGSTVKLGDSTGSPTVITGGGQDKATMTLVNIKDTRLISAGPPAYSATHKAHTTMHCPLEGKAIGNMSPLGDYPLYMYAKDDNTSGVPSGSLLGIAFAQKTRSDTTEPITEQDAESARPGASIVFIPDTDVAGRKQGRGDLDFKCRSASNDNTLSTGLRLCSTNGRGRRVDVFPDDETQPTLLAVGKLTASASFSSAVVKIGGNVSIPSLYATNDIETAKSIKSQIVQVVSRAPSERILPTSAISLYPIQCTTVNAPSSGIAFGDQNNGDWISGVPPGAAIVHTSVRRSGADTQYPGLQPGHLAFYNKLVDSKTSNLTTMVEVLKINAHRALELWPNVAGSEMRAGMVSVGVLSRTQTERDAGVNGADAGVTGLVHIGCSDTLKTSLSTKGDVNISGDIDVAGTAIFRGKVQIDAGNLTAVQPYLAQDSLTAINSLTVGTDSTRSALTGTTSISGVTTLKGSFSLQPHVYTAPNSSTATTQNSELEIRPNQTIKFGVPTKYHTLTAVQNTAGNTHIELNGSLLGGTMQPTSITIPDGTQLNNCVLSGQTVCRAGKFVFQRPSTGAEMLFFQNNGESVRFGMESAARFTIGSVFTLGPCTTATTAQQWAGISVTKNVSNNTLLVANQPLSLPGNAVQLQGAIQGGLLMPDSLQVGYSNARNSNTTFNMNCIRNVVLDGCISIGELVQAGGKFDTGSFTFDPDRHVYMGRDLVLENTKNVVLPRSGSGSSQIRFVDGNVAYSSLEATPGTRAESCSIKLTGEILGGALRPAEITMPPQVVCGSRSVAANGYVKPTTRTKLQYTELAGCVLNDQSVLDDALYVSSAGRVDFSADGTRDQAFLRPGQCQDLVNKKGVNCIQLTGFMVGGTLRPDRLEIPTGTTVNVTIGSAPLGTTTFKGNVIIDSGLQVSSGTSMVLGSSDAGVVFRAPVTNYTTKSVVDTSNGVLSVQGQGGIEIAEGSKLKLGNGTSGSGSVQVSVGSGATGTVTVTSGNKPLRLAGSLGVSIGALQIAETGENNSTAPATMSGRVQFGKDPSAPLLASGIMQGGILKPSEVEASTITAKTNLTVSGKLTCSDFFTVNSGTESDPWTTSNDNTVYRPNPSHKNICLSNAPDTNSSPMLSLDDGVHVLVGNRFTTDRFATMGAHQTGQGVFVGGGPLCVDAPLSASSLFGSFSRNLSQWPKLDNQTVGSFKGPGSNAYFDMIQGRPALCTVHPFIEGNPSNPMKLQVVVILEFLYNGYLSSSTSVNRYAQPFDKVESIDENQDDVSYNETLAHKRVWRFVRTGKSDDVNVRVTLSSVASSLKVGEVMTRASVGDWNASQMVSYVDDADHFGRMSIGTWRATVIAYRGETIMTENTVKTNANDWALAYYGARIMSISHHLAFVFPAPSTYEPDVLKQIQYRSTSTSTPYNPTRLVFFSNVRNNNYYDSGYGPFSSMHDI